MGKDLRSFRGLFGFIYRCLDCQKFFLTFLQSKMSLNISMTEPHCRHTLSQSSVPQYLMISPDLVFPRMSLCGMSLFLTGIMMLSWAKLPKWQGEYLSPLEDGNLYFPLILEDQYEGPINDRPPWKEWSASPMNGHCSASL